MKEVLEMVTSFEVIIIEGIFFDVSGILVQAFT